VPAVTPAPTPATVVAPPAKPVSAETRLVDSLLAQMTLEEKVGQLNQLSGAGDPTGPGGNAAGVERLKKGDIGAFFNVTGVDTVRKLQRVAVEQTRMHIPLMFGLDVIHGYRTTFPVPLAEASSWNPALAERTARIAADEASAGGIQWTFAPMVDIARDARWGRIVEGAGEDPYLGSAFAAARVRGFQGGDLRTPTQSALTTSLRTRTIAATAKHFAAYGAAEAGRDYNIADVPERTLREVYLPPFHAAVCAGAQTLMASFNEIAGVPAHANHWLLTDVLRGEWGFDGLVDSDWTGIGELLNHGIGADSAEIGRRAITAGVDMDMVSETYVRALPELVRGGRVSQAVLDEAVRRVLRVKYRLGLFDDPYRGADTARERTAMVTAENRAAAREAALESIVLLKNDGALLPLRKDLRNIAVIGALAADTGAVLGNWTGLGRKGDAVSVLDGIRRAVSSRTTVTYVRGASPKSQDSSGIANAVAAARKANAVILVIGETPDMSAEAKSRAIIELPGAQMKLVDAVRRTGVPTIVVLMNGRPLAIQELHDRMPAILETWFLGLEHGTATADVIFGDYNPSGRLPVSFPRVTGQAPIYYAHKNTGRPPAQDNDYSSKYIDVPWTPLYPFGHGLSYTSYTLGAPQLSRTTMGTADTLHVSVAVNNTGKVAGDEVVQLYLRDDVATVTRPVQELRGFQRVSLAPGESRTLDFPIDARDLAFYDVDMRRVVEPGSFTVFVGTSSVETQRTKFTVQTPDGRPVAVAAGCPVVR
jgi:beta-glucosidase